MMVWVCVLRKKLRGRTLRRASYIKSNDMRFGTRNLYVFCSTLTVIFFQCGSEVHFQWMYFLFKFTALSCNELKNEEKMKIAFVLIERRQFAGEKITTILQFNEKRKYSVYANYLIFVWDHQKFASDVVIEFHVIKT